MRAAIKQIRSDDRGGVMVEVTVMLSLIMVFILGSVDFLFAMYQWNAATKAVQHGARIAAVSNPVSSDISAMTGLGSGVNPGDPMPSFTRVCNGGTSACSGGTFNAANLNRIVYGRSNATTCGDATSFYNAGMCDYFRRILPANVVISYEQTGLGYAGRPGGPVPTITVTLQNLPFQFFFLSGLMGFGNVQIAPIATITGEDLSSAGT